MSRTLEILNVLSKTILLTSFILKSFEVTEEI